MIDMTEFKKLETHEARLAYAAEQVGFWRGIQRNLYRIDQAETREEKVAIADKIATADAVKPEMPIGVADLVDGGKME
jgi:predicted transcriptional regulator of viral defense system